MNKLREKLNSHQAPGIEDFELLKPISKGAFGHVYLVRRKGTDKLFAMKAMRKTDVLNKNMIEQVIAERDALAVTKSPFVVQLFYSFQSKSNIFLVMEYLIGGDCKSLLHNLGYFDEELARIYIAEVTLALEYIHKHGIVHRDIKPDNMLISDQGHVKLTDFGLTRITRERKLNFHDLLQTPGTDMLTTPSQRQKFWRTPGQLVSLTSNFTFSVPRSKVKPSAPGRLACINSVVSESPLVSQTNSHSAYKFNAPATRRMRCTSSLSASETRYPSLSTPKTSFLNRTAKESQSDSDAEYAMPIKQIKFASPSNDSAESEESDVSSLGANPLTKCTGITGEFHNMLVDEDLQSCVKRPNELLGRDDVFVENAEPRKKRVRLSSPVKFQLNSSSDDEITFNPKTYFNSDTIITQASFNRVSFNANNKVCPPITTSNNTSPSTSNQGCLPSTSPFTSPNPHLSNSGNCNISGVIHLADTTKMSIPNSEDESSLPLNDDLDIKISPPQKPLDSIDALSPVTRSVTPVTNNYFSPMFLSPDNGTHAADFDKSTDILSPMDIYEADPKYHKISSPVVNANGHEINSSVSDTPKFARGCRITKPGKVDGESLDLFQVPLQPGDKSEQPVVNSCNCSSEGGSSIDSLMHTPGSVGRPKFRSDVGEVMAQSLFRTPANSLAFKGEGQKRTPYRTPKSCRRGGDAKPNGCIIGTPDYLAPEILLDQEHGPSVDWWALGVCLYEFLTGVPPFNDETPELVFQHILNRDLIWPEGDEALSTESTDVVNKLLVRKICNRYSAKEIKSHNFFTTVNWSNLHKLTPPFVPNPDDAYDTTYFEARNTVQNLQISAFRL